MRQGQQCDFTTLSVVGAGIKGIAQQAFDHTKDRLDLPSLAVTLAIKVLFHNATIVCFGQVFWGSSDFGRYRGANIFSCSCPPVILFTVISGVGDDVLDGEIIWELVQDGSKLCAVTARPASGMDTQDHVCGHIGDDGYLGPTCKVLPFAVFCGFGACFVEIGADVSGLQAGGINSSELYGFTCGHNDFDCVFDELSSGC